MSQRVSGYVRKDDDLYETPSWVTAVLVGEGLREPYAVWEPAAGGGKIARVLRMLLSAPVIETDIATGTDFLTTSPPFGCDCIITNPPYRRAQDFIERGVPLMEPVGGQIALLLRTDFDHAKTRRHLFECPQFAKKLVLTRRIRWFENTTGSPSFNHAWFLWDWKHSGPPILTYGP